ncbi:MAG: hypothetical protein QW568_00075 [Candidatus Anstonellaceae archaeon]
MSRKSSKNANLAVLLSLAVIVAAVGAVYFFLIPKEPPAQYGAKLEIYPSFSRELLEGKAASAKFFSSCGAFTVYLDGQRLGDYEQRAEVPISAGIGNHTLEAKNQQCGEKFEFEVKAAECNDGEVRECGSDSCPGKQECAGGFFGSCQTPKKVCVPGQKVGCSSSACSFGYKTCNQCGTEYGPCTPDGSLNTTSTKCSSNASCFN